MSSIQDPDPMGGDGPNKGGFERVEESDSDEVRAEEDEDEGTSIEAEGRGGHQPPPAASKGINPVQHSE
jgi:hypothetical protein